MQDSIKNTLMDLGRVFERIVCTTVVLYLFFSFNTLYSISVLEDLSVPTLILYIAYQSLILIVAFCFFRMTIAKNSTTLELFPEIEDKEESSTEGSLHLNPFEKDSLTTNNNDMEMCNICNTSRPMRSYHCDKCDRCLLLMYKHIDLFDTCIGFTNYKFYIVFLFYSIILSLVSLAAFIYGLLDTPIVFNNDLEESIFTPMLIAIILQALILLCAIYELVYGVLCILQNETPCEKAHRNTDKNVSYDVGKYANWKMIMGEHPYTWFLPTWTTEGDGIKFTFASTKIESSAHAANKEE